MICLRPNFLPFLLKISLFTINQKIYTKWFIKIFIPIFLELCLKFWNLRKIAMTIQCLFHLRTTISENCPDIWLKSLVRPVLEVVFGSSMAVLATFGEPLPAALPVPGKEWQLSARNDSNTEGMTIVRKEWLKVFFWKKKLAQMFLLLDLLPPLGHKKAIGPWLFNSFKTGGLWCGLTYMVRGCPT